MRGIGVAVITRSSAPRPVPFRLQRQPLMHAEAMLLVDHHQREVAEFDRLLKQSVRADENVDAALGKRGKDRLALSALLAAAEEGDAKPGRTRRSSRWS